MNGECDPRRLDELVNDDETWLYNFDPLRNAMNKAWVPDVGNAPLITRQRRSEKVLYTIYIYIFFLPLKGHFATEPT